jgi:spore maturation protein CgeB
MSRDIIILHYESFKPIAEAFRALGYNVIEDTYWDESVDLSHVSLHLACMYQLVKEPLAAWSRKKKYNQAGVPVIVWNRDGPANKGEKRWRQLLQKTGIAMNIYATHSMQDANSHRADSLYLPNAAWDTQYHLNGKSLLELRNAANYKVDVSFFGRIDPSLYPEMTQRHQFLSELALRLDQLGISHQFTGHQMVISQQIDLIQASRVNLNVWSGADTNYHGGYRGQVPSWGLPERCYGVQACGGFLLSDHRKHAELDFQISEWRDFGSLDDCIEKIRIALVDFDATRDIAEAAHLRVLRDHTYRNRVRRLVNAADEWRGRRLTSNPL